jgi:hypothetical protein
MGEKQGKGKYHYHNGDVYEGEWEVDYKNGEGIMQYYNGNKYVGNWKNNLRHG